MKAFAATRSTPWVALVDQAEPVAAADEAIVAVEAYSVNRGETFSLDGTYGTPAAQGTVLGQDIAGRVVVAAADGSGPAVGTRVVGHPEGGGWAERVAVPTSKLAALPDAVETITAAALPLAGLTALRLLREAGSVVGKRILITGASGGVGHYFVEMAVGAGAVVTAVSSSAERGSKLAEFGATIVQDPAQASDAFDIVLESIGGNTFSQAASRLKSGGTIIWFGQASLQPITLDFFQFFANTPLTIKHFPHFVTETTDGQDLETLVGLVATGRLHPEVGYVADWAETAGALTDVAERRIRGNAVLTINEK